MTLSHVIHEKRFGSFVITVCNTWTTVTRILWRHSSSWASACFVNVLGLCKVIPGGKGNGGCFTRMRESSGEVVLPRADYAYVVICVTIKEGEEAQFSLSVLSNFEFSLDLLPFGQEAESLFTPRSEIIEEMEKSSINEHSATGETLDVENLSEDNMDDGEESEDISI
eukprot:389425_1